ncbi:MAG: anhydro-N-acetylmuramic acid kinase [Balneolaceae bacterium]|nr:anhydro-N-acetylmuramic acid kinase [Balneolaceae bacterium]MBO6546652.1 anhydro-N-acetylmuramic acid kinase [Balneolaceae bacterium]MBO6649010.1 anhydro-N-acetylmuramic acid kinase [Balneolaceae bacterium]
MNKQLIKLSEIAQKSSRIIVGLMSGTSLDGLDIALCECGNDSIEVKQFKTVGYDAKLRTRIAAIQSKETVSLKEVTVSNTELAHLYANWVLEALKEWGVSKEEVDLIASHGQTIYHHPTEEQTSTLQIVDGDHIAYKTGIITISDFRQKHTAAGGQGAPLAALMDERLFRDETKHRVLLNLGGIANFTWLPSKESGKEVVTSDTGPANTLIDEAMQKHFDKSFDEGGETASSGTVHSELLKYLLLEPYFRKTFPKTTGQEDFNLTLVENLMEGYQIEISTKDLVATLTKLTTKSIERAFDKVIGDQSYELFVSGGGVHNQTLMKGLEENLSNAEFRNFEELEISADSKEAALMAFLANSLVIGDQFLVNGEEVGLGKVSF